MKSAADNAALFLFLYLTGMAGYSGTPLLKKLGIKPGHAVFVHNPPPKYFDWLSPLPGDINVVQQLKGELNFIHIFVPDMKSLKTWFVKSKKNLKKDGMLWISWPKKSSGVATDLDEDLIRDFGLKEGLVDVKVCAVDEVWSALKFVVRVKDR
jgi:hypothetical protein